MKYEVVGYSNDIAEQEALDALLDEVEELELREDE